MEVRNWVVQPGGTTVREVNPYENIFTGGSHNARHSEAWRDFNKTNPELYHTSKNPLKEGTVLQGEEITQLHSLLVGWVNKSDVKDFTQYLRETRQAVQLVEEEQPAIESFQDSLDYETAQPIADKTVVISDIYQLVKLAATSFAKYSRDMNDGTIKDTITSFGTWAKSFYGAGLLSPITCHKANKSAEQERERIVGLIEQELAHGTTKGFDTAFITLERLLTKIKAK